MKLKFKSGIFRSGGVVRAIEAFRQATLYGGGGGVPVITSDQSKEALPLGASAMSVKFD